MIEYTVLKLINGQDVLCSMDPEAVTDHYISAIDPMTMVSIVSRDGSNMIYLKRYNALSKDKKVNVRRSQIISVYAPKKELVDYYKLIVKYYDEIVDKMIINELKSYTQIFETTMNAKPTEEFKNEIDKHFEDLFSEYEKEEIAKQKRKGNKVH